MVTLFWIYVVIQLISTAYGITVINSIRNVPAVRKKLRSEGYVRQNRNSLYKFNIELIDFLKGFIPFYYAIKAINLMSSKDPVSKIVDEEIESGNYVSQDELRRLNIIENEEATSSIARGPEFFYETPPKYTARKNDLSFYDTYETPVEYITREAPKEEELKLNPFVSNEVVITNEVKEEIKEEVKENNITNADIARVISNLSNDELKLLVEKLQLLVDVKNNKVDTI